MAAVLAAEPRPLREIVPVLPERLDKIVRACLAKDPDERWQTATDLRRELEWLAAPEQAVGRRRHAWLPWAIAGAAVTACLAALLWLPRTGEVNTDPVAFRMTGPWRILYGGQGGLAVSPDGRKIALIAITNEGHRGIWIRELGNVQPRLLVSHVGLQGLFWSADSASIGFTVGNQLRIVDVATGEARTVATNVSAFRGATWNSTGDIVYAPSARGDLLAVKPGEAPRPALSKGEGPETASTVWPSFLPNGKDFLYIRGSGLHVGTLNTARTKRLMDAPASATYTNGHILWSGAGLMARPFDTDRLEFTGKTVQIAGDVGAIGRYSLFSASESTLAYYSIYFDRTMIAWLDPSGNGQPIAKEGTAHAEVSPDGKRILYSRARDLWLWDIATGAESRLTFTPANDWVPAWSPDGKWAVWVADTGSKSWHLLRKRSDGAGSEETLLSNESYLHHLHISPDEKHIAVECGAPAETDLCLFSMQDRKLRTVLKTSFSEIHPQFSPDGKWLALASDSSGKYEVYVYGFPSMSGPWQVSREGGVQPRWRSDGKLLYYLNHRGEIVGVDVSAAGDAFVSGAEHKKVLTTDVEPMTNTSHYAAAPDGKRFIVTQRPNADELQVIRNWSGLLNR